MFPGRAARVRHDQQEILDDFPELTAEDLLACYAFAAARERRMVLTSPGNA